MTRILAPILLLVLLFPSLALGKTMNDLVKRDGLYYRKYTKDYPNVPFSGTVTGQHQGTFKDGKQHGPWVCYHEIGTVDENWTGTFKDGVKVK